MFRSPIVTRNYTQNGVFSVHGDSAAPAMCQFCEESSEIKWKCVNCELFLCNLCCSKIHSKSKASMEHEVINLKDIDTENLARTMRKVDLQNLICTVHSYQKCIIYCKDCNEPVCSKCFTEIHKMHGYKDLDEVYANICEIKELMDKFETNLKFITFEKDQLENKLADGDTNFKETRNIILQTEKNMKEAISKHASNLLQDLDAKWKLSENMIKVELSALKQNGDELEIRKNNLYQSLQTHQATDIFSTTQTLDKSVPNYSAKEIKQCGTKFIPNTRQLKMGSNILGDLYSVPDFKVIKHYQSKNKSVTNIIFCEDDTAFIGSIANLKLQKVKFEDDSIKVETDIKMIVNDMEKTQDGELLVSSGESDLKLYTKDGTFKTFMTFTPLKTTGIHVTKNNKIILGLSDSLEYITTEKSIRKLVVMNLNGDLQHIIEYDKDNKRLLSCPYKIKTLNDKIVVVELLNIEKAGKVIMLNYCEQLHWTYNGCTSINSDQDKFNPRDLAITSSDMILVSDFKNHAIHVLNHAGEIIVCKDVRSLGIEYPISLCIDKHEVLWIGEVSTEETMKVEISCVRLS